MERKSKEETIQYRLDKANESLLAADNLLSANFHSVAVSRMYYACFYAASAALLLKEIHAKSHSGVLKMFSQHYVQTGIISTELSFYYSEMFNRRQISDYDDFVTITKETALDLQIKSEQFVTTVIQTIFSN
jgi:uncharacterized protein (UPF0332 family)